MANIIKDEVDKTFFVMVKDSNTNQIVRFAIPSDTQIGLLGNPSELQLHGKFSLSQGLYAVGSSNGGILNVSDDHSIVAISSLAGAVARITVNLPASPRDGQLVFIKDYNGVAASTPIDIYPSVSSTIDADSYQTISTAYGTLALFWFGKQWYTLVAAGGGGSQWIDSTNLLEMRTPKFIAIDGPFVGTGRFATEVGNNVFFYVSGSINSVTGSTATESRVALFGGDVISSGSFGGILGLSGSLTRLIDNRSYLVAGSNITITSQSNGQVVISGGSSTRTESIVIVAGNQIVDQIVFQTIGAFEFNPTGAESMAPTGLAMNLVYFQPIVEIYPTGVTLETQLFNVTTNAYIAASLLSCSNLTATRLKSADLAASMAAGTNVYEMHMRITNANAGKAICKGAKLFVTWA